METTYAGIPATYLEECDGRGEQQSGRMDDDLDDLRDIIAHALAIADERLLHLVAALLAQCLEELGRPDA